MTFLDGKVVIIAGAGRGLSTAYATAAAEAGVAVMVSDVDADAAAQTVQSISRPGAAPTRSAITVSTRSAGLTGS
jgi:3-oxoacyl-[acyl-carrier protein] reductase